MCGIIGVSKINQHAVYDIYNGLLMLQHRGQDAAGIVTYDGENFSEQRDSGLVGDIFTDQDIERLQGPMGLGHCRYTTSGSFDHVEEAQPFYVNAPLGIYLIHNGNLTNTDELRKKVIQDNHRHLRTHSDTEILVNVLADQIYKGLKQEKQDLEKVVLESVEKTMERISGAYSVITMIDRVGMVAFRDPYGIRPLVMGKKETSSGDEWGFASEDIALKNIGMKIVRDVHPGEAILITPQGKMISHQCQKGSLHPCIFEYVYLARPDSMINHISVYKTRLRLGTSLARQIKESGLEIDSVMPVPDSGRTVALQLSQDLGVKYREGLVKNRYIGRTFIMPNQKERQNSIRKKLNTIELEFRNRNILLVDDSIVRGNTIKRIIQMCREAGANKVYIASGAPPVRYPDVYGIDLPTRRELIAHDISTEEIRTLIGADALFYQTLEDLIEAARFGNPEIEKFHTGFFDGYYPTPEVTEEYLQKIEEKKRLLEKQQNISFPSV